MWISQSERAAEGAAVDAIWQFRRWQRRWLDVDMTDELTPSQFFIASLDLSGVPPSGATPIHAWCRAMIGEATDGRAEAV